MLSLKILDSCIDIWSREQVNLVNSLNSDFSRRYIPTLTPIDNCSDISATIYWLDGEGFDVISETYSENGPDTYVVVGKPPIPYVNESPVFFILQVLARSLVRKGYVVLTDSIVISGPGKTILLLGYPHTGKSTIASIALSNGFKVYSTENSVLETKRDRLVFKTGTRVLVFDPVIRRLYGVDIPSTGKTRHGYEIVDLDIFEKISEIEISIDEIYLLYTSFNGIGSSIVRVKGRKIDKTLWYFATSLLKGLDYYYPRPLDMPIGEKIYEVISDFTSKTRETYSDRFFEAFGSPLEVFKSIFTSR